MTELNPEEAMKSVFKALRSEEARIASAIGLIASESITPPWIRECLCSAFHMRTVEGLVGQRYFPTCEMIDELESEAETRFARLFGFRYANVQPHSATTANIAALISLARPGETVMSLSLKSGGHISHGASRSLASRLFNICHYSLDPTGSIDHREIEKIACAIQPRVIISGASCHSGRISHAAFSRIAKAVEAKHIVDIAHTAGLIASGVLPEDLSGAFAVTFSTQKTLLGPRGGVVLTNDAELKSRIDAAIFPGLQGALHNNVIAGKCACAIYAKSEPFKKVMQRILGLAVALSNGVREEGVSLLGGQPVNHQVVLDLFQADCDTTEFVDALAREGVRTNANYLPGDDRFPRGVRMGTTGLAQLGYSIKQAHSLGKIVGRACHAFLSGKTPRLGPAERRELDDLIRFNQEQYERYSNKTAASMDYDKYGSRSDKHEYDSAKIFRRNEIQDLPIDDPKVPYISHNLIDATRDGILLDQLHNDRAAILIPSHDCANTLGVVLEYARRRAPRARIVTCLSGESVKAMTAIAHRYGATAINTTRFVEWLSSCSFQWGIAPYELLQARGKGLDLFSGVFYCCEQGVENFYFMDADFVDMATYDPLLLLAAARFRHPDLDHVLVATPKRKNDVLHALVDNLDLLGVHGMETVIKSARVQLREIIHLLAGERYCSRALLEHVPIATGYGIETAINLTAASHQYRTGQVENALRPDQHNSREKNECMLLNCTRLLLALVVQGKPLGRLDADDIRTFNTVYYNDWESTILPERPGATVRRFFLQRDLLIPNLQTLTCILKKDRRTASELVLR